MEKIDAHLKYWVEAVEAGIEEIGREGVFTKEEIISIANTIQGAAENKSMFFGEHLFLIH